MLSVYVVISKTRPSWILYSTVVVYLPVNSPWGRATYRMEVPFNNPFPVNIYKGDSISPIKTPKCSFLRTNMQCGFIKVVSMKRGSSNYKMTLSS